MGFFSWNTSDTGRSIANKYSGLATFTVYLRDDKGNMWREDSYEGYGEFGGKDYYELLDEMNGGTGNRDSGIDMEFKGKHQGIVYPTLVEDPDSPVTRKPPNCPFQGYFYDEDFGLETPEERNALSEEKATGWTENTIPPTPKGERHG